MVKEISVQVFIRHVCFPPCPMQLHCGDFHDRSHGGSQRRTLSGEEGTQGIGAGVNVLVDDRKVGGGGGRGEQVIMNRRRVPCLDHYFDKVGVYGLGFRV